MADERTDDVVEFSEAHSLGGSKPNCFSVARISSKFEKKTQREHILTRPDSYIGSTERTWEEIALLVSPSDALPPQTGDSEDKAAAETDQSRRDEKGEDSKTKVAFPALRKRGVQFVPGLFKVFDEILVNAVDNLQRDVGTTAIWVTVDRESGWISVKNNGQGLPVVRHAKWQVFIPELVFGHLLTSSNYDDSLKKTTGGRNGYGAKLTNIFSTQFCVETVDAERRLHYRQEFRNNMSEVLPASVRPLPLPKQQAKRDEQARAKASWTKVAFLPDYRRFGGLEALDAAHFDLFQRRVFDVAGTVPKGVRVYFNGTRVPVSGFREYVQLYFADLDPDPGASLSSTPSASSASPLSETEQGGAREGRSAYLRVGERWEIAVTDSRDIAGEGAGFQQVSFVNGVWTKRGGKHVEAVAAQVVDGLLKMLSARQAKKAKEPLGVKALHVRNHLGVFVNCLIDNPSFDSQTKETLTTNAAKFGSTCLIPDSFFQRVARQTSVLASALASADRKLTKDLKKTDGKRAGRIDGIPKLDDANWAGHRSRSKLCTLILTEGDSAKALAVSGLSVVGRDTFGVFPLRGKLLNVLQASPAAIAKNAEVNQLKQILGLQHNKVYADTQSLRYGSVLIMTDQDHDGSHIKGLVLNLFAQLWPSLLQIPGFLQFFITPIVKVRPLGRAEKESSEICFYSEPQFRAWLARTLPRSGRPFSVKYFKGLGTSTAQEAKEYFRNLKSWTFTFLPPGTADEQAVQLAFGKGPGSAEKRKAWIQKGPVDRLYDVTLAPDHEVTAQEFVHNELIHFSIASNVRAIPSLWDGLKPGQRKILFAAFKKQLHRPRAEIKVAQLAGYVSEQTAYHHGEASLQATIVHLAQDFVGSNNLPFFRPLGQFGTRHAPGGKDAASARYIFTALAPYARDLFPEADDQVLRHREEDGQTIEPENFFPVIPTVLVNGCSGIGTGWATSVPPFNPLDVIAAVRSRLGGLGSPAESEGQGPVQLRPWFQNFWGTVEPDPGSGGSPPPTRGGGGHVNFVCRGCAHVDSENPKKLHVTELPVGKDTLGFKTYLETLLRAGRLSAMEEHHTDERVRFVLTAPDAWNPAEAVAVQRAGQEEERTSTPENAAKKEGTAKQKDKTKQEGAAKGREKLHPFAEICAKLKSTVQMGNMVLFNSSGALQQYSDVESILDEFFSARLLVYGQRKAQEVTRLRSELRLAENKARFVRLVLHGELVLSGRKQQELFRDLRNRGFAQERSGLKTPAEAAKQEKGEPEGKRGEQHQGEEDPEEQEGDLAYLLRLPLLALTREKAEALERRAEAKRQEIEALNRLRPQDLWRNDLDRLQASVTAYQQQRTALARVEVSTTTKKGGKTAGKRSRCGAKLGPGGQRQNGKRVKTDAVLPSDDPKFPFPFA